MDHEQHYFMKIDQTVDVDGINEVINNQVQDWQVVWGINGQPVLGFVQEQPSDDHKILTQYLRQDDIVGREDRRKIQREGLLAVKKLGIRYKPYFSLFFTEPCGIGPHSDNMQCSINFPIRGINDPMYFYDVIEGTDPKSPFLMNARKNHYALPSKERRYYFRIHFNEPYEAVRLNIVNGFPS